MENGRRTPASANNHLVCAQNLAYQYDNARCKDYLTNYSTSGPVIDFFRHIEGKISYKTLFPFQGLLFWKSTQPNTRRDTHLTSSLAQKAQQWGVNWYEWEEGMWLAICIVFLRYISHDALDYNACIVTMGSLQALKRIIFKITQGRSFYFRTITLILLFSLCKFNYMTDKQTKKH